MAADQVFAWEGTDRLRRKKKGEITGRNARVARAALRKRGINPTRVTRKGGGFSFRGGRAGITRKDLVLFTRQLATMIRAGVPLVQSFELVAGGIGKPAMKALILRIRDEVSAGHSLTHAVRTEPAHFDPLFCNLVQAGEQSGALETTLDRLATHKEKSEALKGKVKSAMIYPIAVLAVACLVSGILLVEVVPRFEDIFAGFGAELPALTQLVVDLSGMMQAWWPVVVAGLAVVCFSWKVAHGRSPAMREGQQRLSLRLPVMGHIIDQSCTARFARTLATSFAAGVPLVDALDTVAGAAGNVVYRDAVHRLREDVSSGIQLHQAMKTTGVFPDMVVQMVAIGEESGALDGMLDKAATHYEEAVDNAVEGFTGLIEPLMIVTLGLLVGGLVLAMYLPILSMGGAISG